jgi:hypothetical protein
MQKLWEKRKPPNPLNFDEIKDLLQKDELNNISIKNQKLKSQTIWNIHECLEHFCNSLNALKMKLQNLNNCENKTLIWDKVSSSVEIY